MGAEGHVEEPVTGIDRQLGARVRSGWCDVMRRGIDYCRYTGWIDAPKDLEPALDGDVTCDVAVIGGGLGGMAAALRLAEVGAAVALVEARFCGFGASARNAGQLSGAPAGDPYLLGLLYPRRLRGIVRFAENAVHFIEDLMRRLEIDCQYEPTGNVAAAVSNCHLRKARRRAATLAKAGAAVRVGSSRELGIPDTFLGGVSEAPGGLMDPGLFALGLRRALLREGVRVFERTPATALELDHKSVLIKRADWPHPR
jgi:gamma-glutamylputrescine oxidase